MSRTIRSERPGGAVVRVVVPANVRRVTTVSPCGYCGTRAGLACKHRPFEGAEA